MLAFCLACCASMMAIGGQKPNVLDLWPNGQNPGGWTRTDSEEISDAGSFKLVRNVSHPTLTLYLLKGAKPGTPTVVVCPGGGYGVEAYEHEGLEIVARLNKDGFNAALLKYRLPHNGDVRFAPPLQDAQRAIRLLRSNASTFGIDPFRIGIMGFSAGGHLAATTSAAAEATYLPIDDADKVSARPDFTILIYPAYLDEVEPGHPGSGHLARETQVTKNSPPVFLVQAMDDRPYITGSITYAAACEATGIPLEIHLFAHGGHGYGLRSKEEGLKGWPDLLAVWLGHLFPKP